MKLPKIRIAMLDRTKLGVFTEPEDGVMGPAHLTLEIKTSMGENLLQQLIASPDLVNTLEDLLEYVDPHRAGEFEYNKALLRAKAATIFARREPKLSTVLWRDEFFDDPLRGLSKDHGAPGPQENLSGITGAARVINRASRTVTKLTETTPTLKGIFKRFFG